MKLKKKLFLAFLAIGLIPTLLLGVCAQYIATKSLTAQAYNQLTSIRAIKKQQIESYFAEREGDLHMLVESFEGHESQASWSSVGDYANSKHRFFEQFINTYGYYDLFLIDPAGEVVYSVEKEADYKTNLSNGPYSRSGLGNLYKQVLNLSLIHI